MSTSPNPTLRQRALMSDAQMRVLLRGYYLPKLYQDLMSSLASIPGAVQDLIAAIFADPSVSLSAKASGLSHRLIMMILTERLLDLPGLDCLIIETLSGRQYVFTYVGAIVSGVA